MIFRWWKISLRANAKALPGEIKDSHDDFLYDEKCHSKSISFLKTKLILFMY